MIKKAAFTMTELLFTAIIISTLTSYAIHNIKNSSTTAKLIELKTVAEKVIKNQSKSFLEYDSYEDLSSIGAGGEDINKIISENGFKYTVSDSITLNTKEIFCNDSCEEPGFILEVKPFNEDLGILFNSCSNTVIKDKPTEDISSKFNSEYDSAKSCSKFTNTNSATDNSILSPQVCENIDSKIQGYDINDKLMIHDVSDLTEECSTTYNEATGFDSLVDCSKNTEFKAFVIDTENKAKLKLYGTTDQSNILKITKSMDKGSNLYYEGGNEHDSIVIANGNKGYITLDLADYGTIYLNEPYSELVFTTILSSGDITTDLIFQNKAGGVFKFYNFTKIIFNDFKKIENGSDLMSTDLSYLDSCSNDYSENSYGDNKYASTLKGSLNLSEETNSYNYLYLSENITLSNPDLPDPVITPGVILLSQIPFPAYPDLLLDIEDIVNTIPGGDRYVTLNPEDGYTSPNDNLIDIIEQIDSNNKNIVLKGGDNILNVNGSVNSKIRIKENLNSNIRIDIDGSVNEKITFQKNSNNSLRITGDYNENINLKKGNSILNIGGSLNGSLKFKGNLFFSVINDNDIINYKNAEEDTNVFIRISGQMSDFIKMGKGKSTIDIHDFSGEISSRGGSLNLRVTGDNSMDITLKEGNDKILLYNSPYNEIELDSGNDILEVIGTLHKTVHMGNGDDILILHSNIDWGVNMNGNAGNDTIYFLNYTLADFNSDKDSIKTRSVGIENFLFSDGEEIGDISNLYTIDWTF